MAQYPARDSTPWDVTLKAYIDGEVTRAAADASVIDAKGDLIVGSQDNLGARLPVGTTGQIPTADPTAPLGIKWVARNWAHTVVRQTPEGTDLNTYYDAGVYDAAASNLPNRPPGFANGLLEVFSIPTLPGTVQRYSQYDGAETAVRFAYNGNWQAWRVFAPQDKTVLKTIIDAKGDLIVGTANDTPTRKGAGAQGTVLSTDVNSADGLSWEAEPEVARNLARRQGPWEKIGANAVYTAFADYDGYETYQITGNIGDGMYMDPSLAAAALTGGGAYRQTMWVRGTGIIQVLTAITPGGNIGSNTGNIVLTDAWQEVTAVATYPASTTNIYPVIYAQTAGTTFMVQRFSITKGSERVQFFSGSDPGAYWVAAPKQSESVKTNFAARDVLRVGKAPELGRNLALNPRGYVGATNNANITTLTPNVAITGHPAGLTLATRCTPKPGITDGTVLSNYDGDGNGFRDALRYVGFWVCAETPGIAAGAYLGSDPGGTDATQVILPVGVWKWVATKAPGSGPSIIQAYMVSGDAPDNASVLVAGVMASKTPIPNGSDYVDGELDGCQWLGAANASSSIRVMPSKVDNDMLVWLDAGRAQGSGSPEGRVSAPVGVRYVDKDGATPANGGTGTGAIEWLKVKGGSSSTGWRVSVGDTGFRTMLTLSGGHTGSVIFRRVNDVISMGLLPLFAQARTDSTFLTVPPGFRCYTLPSGRTNAGSRVSVNPYSNSADMSDSEAGAYGELVWTARPDEPWVPASSLALTYAA